MTSPNTQHIDPLLLSDEDFLNRAEAMCGTKAAYVNRAEVSAFVRRYGHALHPYKCPWCGLYHTTSYDRARAKAFTRRLKRLLRSDDTHYPEDAPL